MAIELKNLNYFYENNLMEKQQVFSEVNLTIEEGDIVAVAGETGAGKSTLAEIIAGLTAPKSGKVFIDGIDIYSNINKQAKLLAKRTKQKIGMVFQYAEHQLFEESVLKDISFAPKEMGFSENETKEKVTRAINLIGLDSDILNRAPFMLSGGEKRKVAIAGILAFAPKYLILDEPTVGLDAKGKNEILNLILRLNMEENTTIIFISHNMDIIAEIANKIIVLNNGKVLAYDTVYNVFSNENLLMEASLTQPKISNFLKKLKDEGFNIKTDIFKFDEGVNEIIKCLR